MLLACEITAPPEQDPEIKPYVDRFQKEAQLRGLDFSTELASISYTFEETSFGGVCYRLENRFIVNRSVWNDYTDQGKEYLVFHELGHCILDRDHENEYLIAGECSSIMKGTEDGKRCRRNLAAEIWRTYYVDELFDTDTPTPDWYVPTIGQPNAQSV
ncbi:MAG: hypothetical protein AAF399_18610, partial [Bacteroidota bacterium]